MYTHFFSLKQPPFAIAPDPRYLFMSERHREALAHLLFGVGSGGGFVLLTGEIGAGKTTVCRCFLEQIPENCELAYIFNPRLSVAELLQSVCEEFHIPLPAGDSVKGYVDAINRHLLASHAQGRNNVLIIDEAQNLSADVLEQLRLLTNLETSERKLLQVILIGQPELRTMLARPELEQLAQRVIARYHLGSLTEEETGSYIAHRLAVAGAAGMPFPPSTTKLVYRLTQGVPRRINLLCDRALLGAYVENTHEVNRAILRRSAAEVFGDAQPSARPVRRWAMLAGGVMACAAISAAAWQLMPREAAPVVAKASPAPIKRAPVAAVPVQVQGHAGAETALRELGALWGQQLPAGDPCEAAARLELRCHQGKGGLYELRLLDRPAVLTLRDGAKSSYAVLAALDDANASFVLDGKRQTVSVASLAARFDGSFTTLWQAPRGFRNYVPAGESGADVDWIGQHLARLDGTQAPQLGTPFDAGMRERLRAFQSAQGLDADGLAGPRTWMRLNQLAGVAEPRLLAANKKN
ncbi:ExeA family protein [Massilia cavernae]|uniref:Peptidoglycan-binding protein n=1 Tax=Massilia cavernae TaxID=2320864 RepID=A0A418Y557_9BURK|nr:ExeA family protein [Massilia cavernae]RJG21395.1 peptidoglycan-binding protein [Massilia cavernae]